MNRGFTEIRRYVTEEDVGNLGVKCPNEDCGRYNSVQYVASEQECAGCDMRLDLYIRGRTNHDAD